MPRSSSSWNVLWTLVFLVYLIDSAPISSYSKLKQALRDVENDEALLNNPHSSVFANPSLIPPARESPNDGESMEIDAITCNRADHRRRAKWVPSEEIDHRRKKNNGSHCNAMGYRLQQCPYALARRWAPTTTVVYAVEDRFYSQIRQSKCPWWKLHCTRRTENVDAF